VPLNMLLDFARITNAWLSTRHELILIRTRNDYNCLVGNPATEPEIELFKVQCRLPHVALNEINKLSMLPMWALESVIWAFSLVICANILCYRMWPSMGRQNSDSTWKAAIRYLCSADRKNVMSQDVSVFNDLSNVKIYLNLKFYSYDNLDFYKKRYCPIWYIRAFS